MAARPIASTDSQYSLIWVLAACECTWFHIFHPATACLQARQMGSECWSLRRTFQARNLPPACVQQLQEVQIGELFAGPQNWTTISTLGNHFSGSITGALSRVSSIRPPPCTSSLAMRSLCFIRKRCAHFRRAWWTCPAHAAGTALFFEPLLLTYTYILTYT